VDLIPLITGKSSGIEFSMPRGEEGPPKGRRIEHYLRDKLRKLGRHTSTGTGCESDEPRVASGREKKPANL